MMKYLLKMEIIIGSKLLKTQVPPAPIDPWAWEKALPLAYRMWHLPFWAWKLALLWDSNFSMVCLQVTSNIRCLLLFMAATPRRTVARAARLCSWGPHTTGAKPLVLVSSSSSSLVYSSPPTYWQNSFIVGANASKVELLSHTSSFLLHPTRLYLYKTLIFRPPITWGTSHFSMSLILLSEN